MVVWSLILFVFAALSPHEARRTKFFGTDRRRDRNATFDGMPSTFSDDSTLPDETAEMLKFLMSIEMDDDNDEPFDQELSLTGRQSTTVKADAEDYLGKRIVIEGTRHEVGEIVSYDTHTGDYGVEMHDGSLVALKAKNLWSAASADGSSEEEPPRSTSGDQPHYEGQTEEAASSGTDFVLYVIGDTHGNARQLKLSLLATGFFTEALEWRQEAEENDFFRIYILGGVLDQGVHDLEMIKLIKRLSSHPTIGHKLKFLLGNHEVMLLELHNTLYDFKTGWARNERDLAVMASSSRVSSDAQLRDLQISLQGASSDAALQSLKDQVEIVHWLSQQDVIDAWHGVLLVHGGISMRVWAQAKAAFAGPSMRDSVIGGINRAAKVYFKVLQDCFYEMQAKERHHIPCRRKLILICMKKHPQPFFLSAEGSGFIASTGLTLYRGNSAMAGAFPLTRQSNHSKKPDWTEDMFPGYRRRYIEEAIKTEVVTVQTLKQIISCLDPKKHLDAIPSQALTRDVTLPTGELLLRGVHRVTIWFGDIQVFSDGVLQILSVVDRMKDQWMIKYWANNQVLPGAGAPETCEEQARLGREANVKAMVVAHVTHDFIYKFCQKMPVYAVDTHPVNECSDEDCDDQPQEIDQLDSSHQSTKRGGIHPYGAQALRLELDPSTGHVKSEQSCILTRRGQHCSSTFIADQNAELVDVGQHRAKPFLARRMSQMFGAF